MKAESFVYHRFVVSSTAPLTAAELKKFVEKDILNDMYGDTNGVHVDLLKYDDSGKSGIFRVPQEQTGAFCAALASFGQKEGCIVRRVRIVESSHLLLFL
ncbi:hypothetical protein MP638_006908 [Amoeboaphelidium occidentale]|nr:hypothetical protein MP638_006908 [Amoeboaphelidium occidentale]